MSVESLEEEEEETENMAERMTTTEDEVMAAADKEMEERANRAKELLSQRYKGLRNDQVSSGKPAFCELIKLCFLKLHL